MLVLRPDVTLLNAIPGSCFTPPGGGVLVGFSAARDVVRQQVSYWTSETDTFTTEMLMLLLAGHGHLEDCHLLRSFF